MAFLMSGNGGIHGIVALTAVRLATFGVAGRASASPMMWYLTRTLAVAAYISLTASVLIGALRSVATQARERVSWIVDELHQFVAALATLLVLGHLTTLLLDPYLPFSLNNVLLPLSEPYRPFAVILGILAFYVMVALLLTSWFRSFMPYRMWRIVHYLSFVAFVLVTVHGLLAGSDAGESWMRGIYAGASAGFGFVVLFRVLGVQRKSSQAKA